MGGRIAISCRPALLGLGLYLALFAPGHAGDSARCDSIANERLRNDCRAAYAMPPLAFPDAPVTVDALATARMAIFRPAGDGPFPAVVLLHTCGGLSTHLVFWAEQALAAGYVAFIVDSLGPRGFGKTCLGMPSVPVIGMRIRDAFAALDHLAKFPFVDSRRVAAIGFSEGARVAYRLASPSSAEIYSASGRRFAALVALYGKCFERKTGRNYLQPDIDAPLLALYGTWDQDGDAGDCVPRLQQALEHGAPVQWKVFPGVGHAWDQTEFRTQGFIIYSGGKTIAAYNVDATRASRQLAFDFLAERFKQP